MDDLEFVGKCTNGKRQAWDEFVNKYSRLIYSCIHNLLRLKGVTSLTADNINDIFQEIFLSLIKDNFKKLKGFRGKNGCSLASWLRHVAVSSTIDYLRRLRPLLSLEAEDDEGVSPQEIIADDSPSARDVVLIEEELQKLKECIEGLESKDKFFLELHINRNIGLEDLKDYLKVNRGVIDMRKARIVERLRECFRSKGFI